MRNNAKLNYSNLKIVILSFLFVGSCVFLFIDNVLAEDELQMTGVLKNGDYQYNEFSITSSTLKNKENLDDGKLIYLMDDDDLIKFFANDTGVSVYLLNRTQMANVLLNGTNLSDDFNILSKHKFDTTDKVEFEWNMTYKGLQDWEFESVDRVIYFTILVVNELSNDIRYSLEYPYEDEFQTFMQHFAEMMIWIVFLVFGSFLIYDSKKKKEENPIVSHAYRNYGIALMWAALTTGTWAMYHWYRWMTHDIWVNPFINEAFPSELPIGNNYLSFLDFTAAGFSLLFMNLHVEKHIQNRAKPFQTYALVLVQILLIIGIIVPSIVLVIFFIWLIVVASVIVNILGVYVTMTIKTSGTLRKKSALILVGMICTYITIIGREFIVPDYYANWFGAFFCVVMYYGIKMEAI